ncbi:hypothetical protein RJ641_031126 [Dillenia turbinata]|uniref:Uncharacterized protein n=1 Tax=Dillenia turbinata TaxID=194707 RepID=A0AAN8W0E9_9MAGN
MVNKPGEDGNESRSGMRRKPAEVPDVETQYELGAREFVRASRGTGPDDLINSAIGGFGCGSLLGRLQGGQLGAIKYSVIFAVAGTAFDFVILKLQPWLKSFTVLNNKDGSLFKLPEWSPIQVLDEEALAAKRAREQRFYSQRGLNNLNKEKS